MSLSAATPEVSGGVVSRVFICVDDSSEQLWQEIEREAAIAHAASRSGDPDLVVFASGDPLEVVTVPLAESFAAAVRDADAVRRVLLLHGFVARFRATGSGDLRRLDS